MLEALSFLVFVMATCVTCAILGPGPLLRNPSTHTSPSGTNCVTGDVPVSINSLNVKLRLSTTPSQAEVTEIFQEFFQANSDIVPRTLAQPFNNKDTFDISVRLCYPAESGLNSTVQTVQLLSHGLGLDKAYWDITAGSSCADAAAAAGHATLAFDRLGVGASDKPKPVNIVQFPAHVEVLYQLALGLADDSIGSYSFKNVVGVGHSIGSLIQTATSAKYPEAFAATVITGVSETLQFLPFTTLSTTPAPAKNDPSGKYSNLPEAYVIDPTVVGFQQPFFRYPFYEEKVFLAQYENRGTYTLGNFFTLQEIYGPAPQYKGPVDVVIGQYDFAFCLADCLNPTNRDSAALNFLLPAAASGSQNYTIPETGHSINAHKSAPLAFRQIESFFRNNQL